MPVARRRAALIVARIKAGEEPIPEPMAMKLTNGPTVAGLAAVYLDQVADVRMKPATARACRGTVENHILPRLGKKPALSLDHAAVAALHHGLGQTPTMANRVVELLSRIYKAAEDRELIPEGTLVLTPEPAPDADPGDREALRTDMDLMMAAAGLRGTVVEAPPEGGPELSVKTDAMAVRTSSEAVKDGAGGNLAAATADVTRLRLGLEGTWQGLEIGTGTLVPCFEIGVRHDGGDAETGFGLDLGGGLAWSDPGTGVRAEVSGRGLLTHESAGLRERGIAGSFGWDPTPGSDRGPSLTLSQILGLSAQGGAPGRRGPACGRRRGFRALCARWRRTVRGSGAGIRRGASCPARPRMARLRSSTPTRGR